MTIFDIFINVFPERNILAFVECFLLDEVVSFYEIEAFKNGEKPINKLDGEENEDQNKIYKLNNTSKMLRSIVYSSEANFGFKYYDFLVSHT